MAGALVRVIIDPPRDAALNMGLDDVLLAGDGADAPFTLRLYRWRRPTVSLGYSQCWEQAFDPEVAGRLGIDLVRRRTGGRAVLHANELTYAMVGPAEEGPLAGGIHATYRAIARGLATGLEKLGAPVELVRGQRRERRGEERDRPAACFAVSARYEITDGRGRKLLGSAQRRARGRVLQHGSLPLARPDAELWRALGRQGRTAARVSVGLGELLPAPVRFERVARALARGVADSLELGLRVGAFSSREMRLGRRAALRYRDDGFTRRV